MLNKCLTAKLLKQGYRYHKLRKAFSIADTMNRFQCLIKITFTSGPIGTRILW